MRPVFPAHHGGGSLGLPAEVSPEPGPASRSKAAVKTLPFQKMGDRSASAVVSHVGQIATSSLRTPFTAKVLPVSLGLPHARHS